MHLRRILRATAAPFTLSPLLFSTILYPLLDSRNACALAGDSVIQRNSPPESLNVGHLQDKRSEYENLEEYYEPSFIGVDRGIIGRAEDEIQTLDNNQPSTPEKGLQSGQALYYVFQKDTILGPKSPGTPGLPSPLARRDEDGRESVQLDELRKRQSQVTIYVSLTTCSQPQPNSANTNGAAGQLQLFISTSSSNQKPNQSNHDLAVSMDGGYGGTNFTAGDDVFFSVSAPSNNGFTGNYDYELTVSIDDYYAKYYNEPFNQIVDTDTFSVLIFTKNTTDQNSSTDAFQQWMQATRFSAYVFDQNNPSVIGIQGSSCALDKHKQVYVNSQSNYTGMTTTVDGGPKQQFYVPGLNGSSAYYAIMAIEGNSTKAGGGIVNGGGTVWASTNFKTKSDNNCKIIYNLAFCSDVGYAVPWNISTDFIDLGNAYDAYAQQAYQWFNKSLQQVACNTTSSSQYSLARNCTDCANAYKQWLCAVTMPRCEDFSNNAPYLQPRAVSSNITNPELNGFLQQDPIFTDPANQNRSYVNSSRNSWIDSNIVPAPYKEVLPCQDLCYQLVQSCPAILQFACPPSGFGLNYSYGIRNGSLQPGAYSCNPISLPLNGATSLEVNKRRGIAFILAIMLAAVIL